jgi:hypothetical protein
MITAELPLKLNLQCATCIVRCYHNYEIVWPEGPSENFHATKGKDLKGLGMLTTLPPFLIRPASGNFTEFDAFSKPAALAEFCRLTTVPYRKLPAALLKFARAFGLPDDDVEYTSYFWLADAWAVRRLIDGTWEDRAAEEEILIRALNPGVIHPSGVEKVRSCYHPGRILFDRLLDVRSRSVFSAHTLRDALVAMAMSNYDLSGERRNYCKHCGSVFTFERASRRFCNDTCKNKFNYAKKKQEA